MIVGVDTGRRRYGVAVADDETGFARPLEVVDAATTDPVARVAEIAAEMGARTIVVGRPTSLSGADGPAVAWQQRFVTALRAATPIAVEEFDERLTTVVAERALRSGGAGRRARKAIADAVAAQVMLQDYMDARR